jgi:hypothetical protein
MTWRLRLIKMQNKTTDNSQQTLAQLLAFLFQPGQECPNSLPTPYCPLRPPDRNPATGMI